MTQTRYHSVVTYPELTTLREKITPLRDDVVNHPMYREIRNIHDVVIFMESHVFAVWDFMSLLKNLQRNLTCVTIPWIPQGPVASRRLINEIVLVEESDSLGDSYTSHFELYRTAMHDAGADTTRINAFLEHLLDGNTVPDALRTAQAPQAAIDFVTATWGVLENTPIHSQAAVFAFGREDLIPDMFEQVASINDPDGCLSGFKDYLIRHIEVDADEHSPMAMRMLVDLCGDDPVKWSQCTTSVQAALDARHNLWTAITESLTTMPTARHSAPSSTAD